MLKSLKDLMGYGIPAKDGDIGCVSDLADADDAAEACTSANRQ